MCAFRQPERFNTFMSDGLKSLVRAEPVNSPNMWQGAETLGAHPLPVHWSAPL